MIGKEVRDIAGPICQLFTIAQACHIGHLRPCFPGGAGGLEHFVVPWTCGAISGKKVSHYTTEGQRYGEMGLPRSRGARAT